MISFRQRDRADVPPRWVVNIASRFVLTPRHVHNLIFLREKCAVAVSTAEPCIAILAGLNSTRDPVPNILRTLPHLLASRLGEQKACFGTLRISSIHILNTVHIGIILIQISYRLDISILRDMTVTLCGSIQLSYSGGLCIPKPLLV